MIELKFDKAQAVSGLREFAQNAKDARFVGAQAAAEVFYEEARERAPVRTGLLRSAIYQAQSKDNSTDTKAVYHVSWNASKAPHGHLVEYGTSRAPAHPFIRPAFEAKKKQAIAAGIAAYSEKLALK